MYTVTHANRFMLVGLVLPRYDKEKMYADFTELESLVRTYGGQVFAVAIQSTNRRDEATFIGSGKAQEIADEVLAKKIDIVVINASVKPRQISALREVFAAKSPDIKVWDRVDLILHIFDKHAVTAESKLQIKLASIRHMGPSIYGIGRELSQQGGGIGTRGGGETTTELMHRHWKNEIRQVQKQLTKQTKGRFDQMQERKQSGLTTISIVGYTNAGKTSLFNMLSGEHKLAQDSLFVTLDSNVGKLYLPKVAREAYLSDTIGFIQNLPPQLIDSFKSTLLETVNADLLLHVIDASDPRFAEKIVVVNEILQELAIDDKKQIYVFNKIDLVKDINKENLLEQYRTFNPQFISCKTHEGKDKLLETIQNILE